jgi:hypothetical protein
MKKRFLSIAIMAGMLLTPFWAAAQEDEEDMMQEDESEELTPDENAYLKPQKENGRWGYVSQSGEIVVPFKYEAAKKFSEDMAAVRLRGKWGFVDNTGAEVIPPVYDGLKNFSNGMAAVKSRGRWGFVDKAGNEAVPPVYDGLKNFSNDAGAVKFKKKWGFVDRTGKEIIPPAYDGIRSFSDDMAAVKSRGKWGFVDRSGNEAVPPVYENIRDFSEGMAMVSLKRQWGFVDKTGREITPVIYNTIDDFSADGLAAVEINKKIGYIDRTGKEVIPVKYEQFRESSATRKADTVVKKLITAVTYIKSSVKSASGYYQSKVRVTNSGFFTDGVARAKLNGKYGYIDAFEGQVIPFQYDYACDFQTSGLAWVRTGRQWELIDRFGEKSDKNSHQSGIRLPATICNTKLSLIDFYPDRDGSGNTLVNIITTPLSGLDMVIDQLRCVIVSNGREYHADRLKYTEGAAMVVEYFFDTDAKPEMIILYTVLNPALKMKLECY